VTIHEVRACVFPWAFSPEPPAPPSPTIPADWNPDAEDTVVQYVTEAEFELGGTVSDYNAGWTCDFAQNLFNNVEGGTGNCCCNEIQPDDRGVPTPTPLLSQSAACATILDAGGQYCSAVSVAGGSVIVSSRKIFDTKLAADLQQNTMQASLGDNADSASAVLGIRILRAPVISVEETFTFITINHFNATAASVTVLLGILFILCMIALYFKMKKGKGKKPVYPA